MPASPSIEEESNWSEVSCDLLHLIMDKLSSTNHVAYIRLSRTMCSSLEERCKVHFEEEEKELLPLLEAIELNAEQLDRMVEQCFEVMESTHSHLFGSLAS